MTSSRRMRLRGRKALAAVGTAVVLASLFAVSASAVPSNFIELDNNVVDNSAAEPPYDWANSGALTTPNPLTAAGTWSRAGDGGIFNGGAFVNNTTVPTAPSQVTNNATIVDADFVVDPMSVHVTTCGTGDPTVFTGQGSEKNGGLLSGFTYSTASVPNKDDLANIYALAHVDGATNEIFFGAERVVNNGDSHIDFEFLQSTLTKTGTCAGNLVGTRSQGDLLLTVDFTNGGALGGTQLYEWHCVAENQTQPADGTPCNPPATGKSIPHYQATTNTATVFGVNGGGAVPCGGWVCLNPDGSATNSIATNELMEGGIDLAQLGFTGCFSTLLPHTRSSQQFTATLKDFAIVNFSTCGTPEIETTPDPEEGTVGETTLNDDAVLSGGLNPTGNIIFKLFPPDDPDCEGTPVYTDTVTVSGNGNYSTDDGGYLAIATGTYHWTAFFDSANPAQNPDATSACADEPVVIAPATPSIETTPDPEEGTVGETTLNDDAVLSDGYNPTGTITFKLFPPDDPDCEGTPVYTDDVTVNGNGSYSTDGGGYLAIATGTYHWTADYSGDDNNEAASSACADEPVVIGPVSPAIVTTPSPNGSVVLGTVLNDTAVLSDGFEPTGTITFKLFPPDDADCEGTEVFSNTVNVNGNGSYSTSAGYTSIATGTYHWTADYSGDDNNDPASSACADEPVTIIVASTILTKAAAVETTVTYTYTEENDGSVPLTDPSVEDPDCVAAGGTVEYVSGDANTNGILDPGETWTFECTATYTGEGDFTNVATGHGTDPLDLDVTFCEDEENPDPGVRCDQDERDTVTVSVTITGGKNNQ